MTEPLEDQIARFDGGNDEVHGEQYMKRCKGGAINPHIYSIGNYSGCNGCEYQDECLMSAFAAGEQGEL